MFAFIYINSWEGQVASSKCSCLPHLHSCMQFLLPSAYPTSEQRAFVSHSWHVRRTEGRLADYQWTYSRHSSPIDKPPNTTHDPTSFCSTSVGRLLHFQIVQAGRHFPFFFVTSTRDTIILHSDKVFKVHHFECHAKTYLVAALLHPWFYHLWTAPKGLITMVRDIKRLWTNAADNILTSTDI